MFKQLLLTLLLLISHFSYGYGETDGYRFAQERENEEQDYKWKLKFSGTADVRFVATDLERSFDRPHGAPPVSLGGDGITRYGGVDIDGNGNGDRRGHEFKVPQMSLVTSVAVQDMLAGHFHLIFTDAYDNQKNDSDFDMAEAYLSYTFDGSNDDSFSFKGGFMYPPISSEHLGVGWSTVYTTTPSALNSWVGEEIRVQGVELAYSKEWDDHYLDLYGSLFTGNDPAGTVLVLRGFTLNDRQSTFSSQLRHRKGGGSGSSAPFQEIDGKLGWYAGASLEVYDVARFSAIYWDNNGDYDHGSFDTDSAVWDTRFLTFGVDFMPNSKWDIVTQTMLGETQRGPTINPTADHKFWAAYLLGRYTHKKHAWSLRLEQFEVTDKHGRRSLETKGEAVTGAYTFSYKQLHQILFEYIYAHSEMGTGSDPNDNLMQLTYRLRF